MDTTERLIELFESDRNAPDYAERFPIYSSIHDAIGCKPWHPPAERVWQTQGIPEAYDDPEMTAEVWEILQSLYAEYRRAVES